MDDIIIIQFVEYAEISFFLLYNFTSHFVEVVQ